MLALIILTLVACEPFACNEPCDSATVARAIAGPDATDCGSAVSDDERATVEACMASAFTSSGPFVGLVESPAPGTDRAILIRGFARGSDDVLREVLGTRQPDRAIVQTRICFAAVVDAASQLRCTEPMDGLFLECQCVEEDAEASMARDAGVASP